MEHEVNPASGVEMDVVVSSNGEERNGEQQRGLLLQERALNSKRWRTCKYLVHANDGWPVGPGGGEDQHPNKFTWCWLVLLGCCPFLSNTEEA